MVTEATESWTEAVRAITERLNESKDGLDERRTGGLERFQMHGFPGRKSEEWRYTPLSGLVDGGCHQSLSTSTSVPQHADLPLDAIARVVLINGCFQEQLSDLSALGDAIKIGSIAALRNESNPEMVNFLCSSFPEDDHPFGSLSDAMLDDGVFIEVSGEGSGEPGTVHVLHAFDGSTGAGSAHITGLVRCAPGSRLKIVEEVRSTGEVLGNIRWGMSLGDDAVLDRIRVFRPGCDSVFHGTRVTQNSGSQFHDLVTCCGSNLIRNEIHATHSGPGCHVDLLGAYVARGKEVVDHHTTIEHAVEDCTSREIYRGVLSEKSRGVFTGMIHVHQDAQRTDAVQSNDAIVLSRDAEMNTRPRLEIYADDVKCTHGATVGELDDDALFYLRSRGISLDEAKKLLVRAFTSEVLAGMESSQLREFIIEELQRSIPGDGESSS
ncbi:MAG: Fe-S cluster assembly protein SufD [Planctomycetota bacterium]|nr:Fe-S cluster assembly protein SufD [Planctomycetota bacterium]